MELSIGTYVPEIQKQSQSSELNPKSAGFVSKFAPDGKSFTEFLASYSIENVENTEARPVEKSAPKAEQLETKPVKTEEKVSEKPSADDSKKTVSREKNTESEKDTDGEPKLEKVEVSGEMIHNLQIEVSSSETEIAVNENLIENELAVNLADAVNENQGKNLQNVAENSLEKSNQGEDFLQSAMALAVESGTQQAENLEFTNDFSQEQDNEDSVASGQNVKASDSKKSKITVTDLRTEKAPEKSENSKVSDSDSKEKVQTVYESKDSATITMNLNQDVENVNSNVLSSNSQAAASDGSNFQAMINNQIQENVPEFVKAGNIVLRDNGKGTINLVLHPDDLGNVKISLSLDGKSLTGHITVNTKEALEVFRNNAETLREAFIRSGFDAAGFDVSFAENSSSGQQNFAEEHQRKQNEFFAQRIYGSMDTSGDEYFAESENSRFEDFAINIVA